MVSIPNFFITLAFCFAAFPTEGNSESVLEGQRVKCFGGNPRLRGILDSMDSKIQTITQDLAGLSTRVQSLEMRHKTLETTVSALTTSITALEAQILALTRRHSKLDAVNGIWKRNFKIVNATFALLRTKLRFQMNPILGS